MAAPRKKYTVRTNSWLNIREEPTKESKVIGKLFNGDAITIEPKAEVPVGWFMLKDGGYVMAEFVE